MREQKIAIGDSITFKAATRSDFKTATRKIVGIDQMGRPQVRYHGWDKFVVAWHEVKSITKAEASQ